MINMIMSSFQSRSKSIDWFLDIKGILVVTWLKTTPWTQNVN